MDVRAYYWNSDTGRLARLLGRHLKHGNAGDAFNEDLLKWAYPDARIANVADEGRRLLLVGSIIHQARPGDIVNGVGTKREELPPPPAGEPLWIRGVRGPRTRQKLIEAGHDVSRLEFLGDPGLLIGRIHPELLQVESVPGSAIFIPHYKERRSFRDNARYAVVDIDAPPVQVGRRIRQAEIVYSSSLHGVIWAHALGRPAVLIASVSEQPIKYQDYFESVGLAFTASDTIDDAVRDGRATLPERIDAVIDSITMPSADELIARGILR